MMSILAILLALGGPFGPADCRTVELALMALGEDPAAGQALGESYLGLEAEVTETVGSLSDWVTRWEREHSYHRNFPGWQRRLRVPLDFHQTLANERSCLAVAYFDQLAGAYPGHSEVFDLLEQHYQRPHSSCGIAPGFAYPDVVELVEATVPEALASEEVLTLLRTYSVQFDGLLKRRRRLLDVQISARSGAVETGQPEELTRAIRDAVMAEAQIHRLGARTAERLAVVLDPTLAHDFTAAYEEVAYPTGMPSLVPRLVDQALADPQLDPETRVLLESTREEWSEFRRTAEEDLAVAFDNFFEDESIARHAAWLSRFILGDRGSQDEPFSESYQAIAGEDDQWVSRVQAIIGR